MIQQQSDTGREDTTPPVYYVPGAENHYKYDYDVIVLDEELKNYPAAHDYILAHERHHATAEGRTFTGFVRHELQSDLDYYFGSGETLDEVREYYRERDPGSLGARGRMKIEAGNALRSLWRPVFRAVSWLESWNCSDT